MKRVLLVDDDALVLKMYRDGLTRQGFEVDTATDGLAATKALCDRRPDIMVLDLMMPRFTGLDVLKFIRAQPDLARIPVIVLSNAYMDEMARDVAVVGVQRAIFKVRCTPSILTGVINDVLAGKDTPPPPDSLVAAPKSEELKPPAPTPAAPPSTPAPPNPPPVAQPKTAAPLRPPTEEELEFKDHARKDFLGTGAATCNTLRKFLEGFVQAKSDKEQAARLEELSRKVHFLAAAAGMAECHHIAQMASALEALLYVAMDDPARLDASVMRTSAMAVDFLEVLFVHARDSRLGVGSAAQVLVVDDDPLSNRRVVSALRSAQIPARSTEDPLLALQWLPKRRYGLILLDIEMPGMDGFDFCKRLRALPGYEKTPVIYVTSHSDFDSRAKSVESGGNDLIAKPVFAPELAVKAVLHLLKSQLPA